MAVIKEKELAKGLVRCPVCYRETEVCLFGKERSGVWVGCNHSPECARYIVWHGVNEGCTLAKAKREWNRKNSGILGLIRRAKIWLRLHGYLLSREEKAWERRQTQAKKALKQKEKQMMEELLSKRGQTGIERTGGVGI